MKLGVASHHIVAILKGSTCKKSSKVFVSEGFLGIRDQTSSTSCITRLLSASFSTRPDKTIFAKFKLVDEKKMGLASEV